MSMSGRIGNASACLALAAGCALAWTAVSPSAQASPAVTQMAASLHVLVLDADSIVFPRYAKTLLGIMEGKDGARIGVAHRRRPPTQGVGASRA